MAEYQGYLRVPASARFAIVASRFNGLVTERLVAGAVEQWVRLGVARHAIDLIWVPGAFELAGAVARLAPRGYAAIVALGTVVRGETPHFDYVAGQSAAEIGRLAANGQIPVIYGVLTCNTMDEAQDRAGGKSGNKGSDAALAAIEMADLYHQLDASPEGGA